MRRRSAAFNGGGGRFFVLDLGGSGVFEEYCDHVWPFAVPRRGAEDDGGGAVVVLRWLVLVFVLVSAAVMTGSGSSTEGVDVSAAVSVVVVGVSCVAAAEEKQRRLEATVVQKMKTMRLKYDDDRTSVNSKGRTWCFSRLCNSANHLSHP